ncbi:unnamed protein product [Gordionus sp. m RMFG-2023]|uniref:inositol hexakisphosphate and diphosphoinositol-pentakisphosphate kinase 2-like isoform X2 n=1 Tax=Gordionus sp. m RMFG-2023 TaxID=3053472 RepID=UPI0030E5936C
MTLDNNSHKQIIVGVCAMEKKSKSKPMHEILQRLDKFEYISTYIISQNDILNEPVENWPIVDCLISFHSQGFRLEKAIEYSKLRNPLIINDLPMQYKLMDRREVYRILENEGLEMPRYVVLDRTNPDSSSQHLIEGEDHIEINGRTFNKPFVEKPLNAEDHNVYIYYPVSAGGGSQRLFRKIGSRSSVYSSVSLVRKTGCYIYEEFMPTDGTDVKVYTVGPDYAHAEARKSPALDGKVERDLEGKEQLVCGFDLLRANGKSFVCDVNGFSFVKNSRKYYDDCAMILGNFIMRELAPTLHIPWTIPYQLDDPPIVPTTYGKMMELRCVIAVIRHADRTPKQKMKMEVKHQKFFDLFAKYDGYKTGELKLKKPKQLQEILDITRYLLEEFKKQQSKAFNTSTNYNNFNTQNNPLIPGLDNQGDDKIKDNYNTNISLLDKNKDINIFTEETNSNMIEENPSKLEQLKQVLEMYGHFSGINRKVQLKYQPYGSSKLSTKCHSSASTTTSTSTSTEPPKNRSSISQIPLKPIQSNLPFHLNNSSSESPLVDQNSKSPAQDIKSTSSSLNPSPDLNILTSSRSNTSSSNTKDPSLFFILKWGGELTQTGRQQAEDLGKAFRSMYPGGRAGNNSSNDPGCGLLRLHSTYRHDLKIYASDEGRVQMTAAAFAKGFLALEGELTPILVQMVKSADINGLLDHNYESSSTATFSSKQAKRQSSNSSSKPKNWSPTINDPISSIETADKSEANVNNINTNSSFDLRHLQQKFMRRVKSQLNELLNTDCDINQSPVLLEELIPTHSKSLVKAIKFIKNPFRMCIHLDELIKDLICNIKNHMFVYPKDFSHPLSDNTNRKSRNSDNACPLYHDETWDLMFRRWTKLEKDFKLNKNDTSKDTKKDKSAKKNLEKCKNEDTKENPFVKNKANNGKASAQDINFDISKIPDIYDSAKYDMQHNAQALNFNKIEELFLCSKAMADIVIPQEYGITAYEKLVIAQSICTPLMNKMRTDLKRILEPSTLDQECVGESITLLNANYSHGVMSPGRHVRTRLYFTSESHIHSLLTILRLGQLCPPDDLQWQRSLEYISAISELNYITQIVIMLYEDPTKNVCSEDRWHVELHFSVGAKNAIPCDADKPFALGFRPHHNNKKKNSVPITSPNNDNNPSITEPTPYNLSFSHVMLPHHFNNLNESNGSNNSKDDIKLTPPHSSHFKRSLSLQVNDACQKSEDKIYRNFAMDTFELSDKIFLPSDKFMIDPHTHIHKQDQIDQNPENVNDTFINSNNSDRSPTPLEISVETGNVSDNLCKRSTTSSNGQIVQVSPSTQADKIINKDEPDFFHSLSVNTVPILEIVDKIVNSAKNSICKELNSSASENIEPEVDRSNDKVRKQVPNMKFLPIDAGCDHRYSLIENKLSPFASKSTYTSKPISRHSTGLIGTPYHKSNSGSCLISTALISGKCFTNCNTLENKTEANNTNVCYEGPPAVPHIRPLETLHNALSLKRLDSFLYRMTEMPFKNIIDVETTPNPSSQTLNISSSTAINLPS